VGFVQNYHFTKQISVGALGMHNRPFRTRTDQLNGAFDNFVLPTAFCTFGKNEIASFN
jgi:hypothetical protein|tara:strand:+ start:283 stop:456 length:174 start_codon:yes stop_codon:yes gene_type:complete